MTDWRLLFVLLLPLRLCSYTEGTLQESFFTCNLCSSVVLQVELKCIYSIPLIAEAVVKTIGREPDVTPVCATAPLHIITLIVCKIRREISGGEECRLLYQHGQDFVHECDSRFTLKTENETVFLHLTGLIPVDSGNYSCECSHVRGTDILHVIITVKGKCCMLLHGHSNCTVSKVFICCCVCFNDSDVVFYFGLNVLGEEEASASIITMLIYATVISCGTAFTIVTCFLLGLIVMKIHRR